MKKHIPNLSIKDWRKIAGIILLITLVLSIIYSIVQIIISPSALSDADSYKKIKSDYVLMLFQCILGVVVMAVPTIVEKKWSIGIPNYMYILYFVFLFCAIYLGEVREFYYLVPQWDNILHAFSGAMLGALGFTLVSILNDAERVKIQLSPFFVALFAFCFALAAGAVWEIYEYTFDGLLSVNMQKYALENGTQLVGRAALADTMTDLIVDASSSLIISVLGFFSIRKNNGHTEQSKEIKELEQKFLKLH
ncbi:MAG: hypothetical protein Q8865_00965 [Bacillota bacterium]|nr:hypothetical protein [Bacillota bacterium]